MVGWYNTCKLCKDGYIIGRFCSFKKEKCTEGCHWDIHKGTIHPDFCDPEKVMVKVWPDPNMSHGECDAEVKKLDFAELVIQSSGLKTDLGVARTYTTYVYKECRRKEKKNKTVKDGTKVVVQDRFDGQIRLFLDLEEEKKPCWDPQARSIFHSLVLASYKASGGKCVISSIKGLRVGTRNSRQRNVESDYGSVKFLITSLTVHSVSQEFGSKDKGGRGIEIFLESAGPMVPEDLKDAHEFAEKLRTKTSLREKPVVKTTPSCEDTANTESSSTCSSSISSPPARVKDSAVLLTMLDVALTPSSCWNPSHNRGRYFMGKYYSDSEDEH